MRTYWEREVQIPVDAVDLEGTLIVPKDSDGIVLFAHGSGSSRLSPRNRSVAEELRQAKLATLLFDLLTEQEDAVYQTRFDIELLKERLVAATKWVQRQAVTRKMNIGYFGSSTGAAAALMAAATLGQAIGAVVSRGGRPDLASDLLGKVNCPVLLIVGGNDLEVLRLNQHAYDVLHSIKQLEIVEGATHLFEEPGTLVEVSRLAAEWFLRYLG